MEGYYKTPVSIVLYMTVLLSQSVLGVGDAQSNFEGTFDESYYPYNQDMGYGSRPTYEQGFMADWSRDRNGWPVHGNNPKCIDIPSNLSLCHNIGYQKMRLPNLLDHDTLAEVSQQAATWVPLLGVGCHPDTQLFLCSLFTPVCLDRPIPPCRNLCQAVKQGCEVRMLRYGFPWPEILDCEQFPLSNDLCLGPQSGSQDSRVCQACNQPETFEAIVDNYCTADYVIRVKLRGEITETQSGNIKKLLIGKKKRLYKKGDMKKKKQWENVDLYIENSVKCDCGLPKDSRQNDYYFAMLKRVGSKLEVTALHLYNKSNHQMRRALRAIRKKDKICTKKGMEALSVNDESLEEENSKKAPKKGKKVRNGKNKKNAAILDDDSNGRSQMVDTTQPPESTLRNTGNTSATTNRAQQGRVGKNKKGKSNRNRDPRNRRQKGNKRNRAKEQNR